MNKQPKVSVIIPTFNRKEILKKILSSYLDQKFVCEVIIINDGSTEDYSSITKYFKPIFRKKDIDFVYLEQKERKGAPVARNLGIKKSEGNLLLFSDDDILLKENLVEKGVKKLLHSNADIIGARAIDVFDEDDFDFNNIESKKNKKDRSDVFNYLTLEGRYSIDTKEDVELPFVFVISLWKRWIFDKGVRFDESYKGNQYREETSAQVEASKLGAKIVFSPELVSWHIRQKTGGQRRDSKLLWCCWSVRNNTKFLKKYYPFLKNKWQLKYPCWFSWMIFSIRQTAAVFVPRNIRNILRK
ncbi:hypothetical protein ES704_03576 [subsurface metagenome]|jgi:glycosyltransferase involved in cell wall biosynthesis